MTYRLSIAAALILMLTAPALAADQSTPPNSAATGSDSSSGAKEQSSAPAGSAAESDLSNKSSPRSWRRSINRRKGTEFSSSWIIGSNRSTTGQR